MLKSNFAAASCGLSTALMAVAVCLSGCSKSYDGPPRYPVSGTVTYQGAPVEDGAIVFFPLEMGGGPQIGLIIQGGAFEGEVTAGLKKVCIEGYRPGKTVLDDEGNSHEVLDYYIPGKYGEGSKLTHTVLAEPNEGLVFDLK
ncbi:hypothetical protein [Blastopirellula marina]|nr:hypothetical protein [Blastopirellula marina]